MNLTDKQLELASKLTTLQRKFIIELVKPKTSQRQAYIKAGGTAKTEQSQDSSATKMFSNVKVRAFYNSLMESKTVSSIMERDEALNILSTNARVKMTDVADFGWVEIGRDEHDNPIMQTVWTMKNSDEIEPAIISCIKSVTLTNKGPKIELHDQQGAIKQLTDILGWAVPKKTELTGADGGALKINTEVTALEVANALDGLLDKL
jgi:phage terminase small subunit